ncbi:MAG: hypothetical protein ACR2Q4_18460, partial [Geminicoccaceae bacterium]
RPNFSLVPKESPGLERRGADVSYGASDQSDRLPDSAFNRPKRRLPSAALVIAALATGLGIAVSADSHRLPLTSWHGTEMHDVSGSGTNLDPLEKSFSIP